MAMSSTPTAFSLSKRISFALSAEKLPSEYKSELTLTPIWHIYMPIDEYVDGGYYDAEGPSHICVNAVTGELVVTD